VKRVLKENINTKDYWDELLTNEIWGRGRGKIYNKLIPFFEKNKEITALDIGCAIGHGIMSLSSNLPNVKFEACDFSTTGIKKAKELYSEKIRFFVHDVLKDDLDKDYDYILFVETLEHVDNPKKIIKKYLKNCKKMMVTVPYKEGLWKEHVYQFDEFSFDDIKELKEYHLIDKGEKNRKIILFIFENLSYHK
jgi:2-polyprenyl-3-methyl-5-hydroxy-6-metoxy-1,4-benzoquinol methylase